MSFTGTHLTTATDIKYNGVQFTEVTKSEVKIEPVWNKAGTAVKYNKYTFKINAIISGYTTVPNVSGSPSSACTAVADTNMKNLRRLLTESGKEFRYKDKGLGDDLIIDTTGQLANGRYDIKYGPKPTMINFEPVASNKVCRVVMVIEVHMTDCNASTQPKNVVAEFHYRGSLSINKAGYRKYIRTGFIEVASPRVASNRTIARHTADFYQDIIKQYITGETLDQFHLESTYDFSADGTSCNFIHTFTEIESRNPYPEGIVEIDMSHATKSSLFPQGQWQAGFKAWTNTIEGSIRVRRGLPTVWAWIAFTLIAEQRIGLGVEVTIDQGQGGNQVNVVRVPIILEIEVTEEMYGEMINFSVTWMSFGQTIEEAFARTGIFQPIDGNWNAWKTDIREAHQNPEGGGEPLKYNASNRLIVLPCSQSSDSIEESPTGEDDPQGEGLFSPDCPPDEASYIDYKLVCKVMSKNSQKTHRRYLEVEEINREGSPGETFSSEVAPDRTYNRLVKEKDYNIQDTGNDDNLILLKGYSIRMGRPTRPPEAVEYNGRKLKLADDKRNEIDERIIAVNGDCPVYLTKWKVYYQIMGAINERPLNVDSTGSSELHDS